MELRRLPKRRPWVVVGHGGAHVVLQVPSAVRVHGVQAGSLGAETKTSAHRELDHVHLSSHKNRVLIRRQLHVVNEDGAAIGERMQNFNQTSFTTYRIVAEFFHHSISGGNEHHM